MSDILKWLTAKEADVSIRYQAGRDLLDKDPLALEPLRERIALEGWGARYLAERQAGKHWGQGYYAHKWISSHYTLLELRNLELPGDIQAAREVVDLSCADFNLLSPVPEKPKKMFIPNVTAATSVMADVCVNGMFMNFACWFGVDPRAMVPVVDFILEWQMPDGGFNCDANRADRMPVHSALNSTLCVLEGILTYRNQGYVYRLDELSVAAAAGREFILQHRLYKSDHTGETIHPSFVKLSYPGRWRYDILRALDHFRDAGTPYDERMEDALSVLRGKQRKDGAWPVQNRHVGQEYFRMEKTGGPSRWNTLRALRVLRKYDPAGYLAILK